MRRQNTRLGLWLFAVYLVFYGGFVALAAFWPGTMEATPLAGVNVAIWYGFGLIAVALVLALIYGWMCRASRPGRESAIEIPPLAPPFEGGGLAP